MKIDYKRRFAVIKKLRVYIPFTANELKRQMVYKGAFYLFIFITLFGSFISYFLWMAIYHSSESGMLGGFTRDEMIVYVFMVYITKSVVAISISDSVSDDVVKGMIAMYLIKPIDYRLGLIFKAMGKQIYYFFVPGIFIWIGLELYKYFALGISFTPVSNVLLYLVSCCMSFLIYVLFDFCFGMMAFFTTYIFGMRLAKDALLSFLTGQLLPLSFFPEAFQRIFEYLPFSAMIYSPVMIYLGKYQGNELAFVLLKQGIWIVALYLLGSFIWNQVTKRLVVLGG